ncbi:MAG: hypothetical protein R3D03_11030 [Geminicoccaceae bacterium]
MSPSSPAPAVAPRLPDQRILRVVEGDDEDETGIADLAGERHGLGGGQGLSGLSQMTS